MLVYNNVLVQVGKCGFIVFTEEILNGTFHFLCSASPYCICFSKA